MDSDADGTYVDLPGRGPTEVVEVNGLYVPVDLRHEGLRVTRRLVDPSYGTPGLTAIRRLRLRRGYSGGSLASLCGAGS